MQTRRRGQMYLAGWRARRRRDTRFRKAARPVLDDLLGGVRVAELSREQRNAIADLVERSPSFDDPALRADVRAVIEGRPTASRRLGGALRRVRETTQPGEQPPVGGEQPKETDDGKEE